MGRRDRGETGWRGRTETSWREEGLKGGEELEGKKSLQSGVVLTLLYDVAGGALRLESFKRLLE